ncbi:MAG: hypothetical protein EHM58_02290 [Ignavibacteriae bacterium]|nr:MAG: hypothetical protein EHM58_02290 [Ignavibacteriota bacterium]
MTVQVHKIGKEILEVEMQNSIDAFSFQNELADLCKQVLIPAIENLFNRKNFGENIIQIEKLEIDAGVINYSNWKNGLVDKVIYEFERYLDKISCTSNMLNPIANIKFVAQKLNDEHTILHFLKTGDLPWSRSNIDITELQKLIIKVIEKHDEGFFNKLFTLFKSEQKVRDRFIFQFGDNIVEEFILRLFDNKIEIKTLSDWKKILRYLKYSDTKITGLIFKTAIEIFELLSDKLENKEDVQTEIKQAFGQNIISNLSLQEIEQIILYTENNSNKLSKETADVIKKSSKYIQEHRITTGKKDLTTADFGKNKAHEKQSKTSSDEHSWYISNSGLVILHSFLPLFFENCGYTEKNEWQNIELQQRAIALTQYLITGVEEYPEFDLLLNKIICGYEVDNSLPAVIKLSDFEKNETNDLLLSVIGHWKALKNTTASGLRDSFLKRNGKLSFLDDHWLLQVEKKGWDILIDKMPWGFSYIKLPWMKKHIIVEW